MARMIVRMDWSLILPRAGAYFVYVTSRVERDRESALT